MRKKKTDKVLKDQQIRLQALEWIHTHMVDWMLNIPKYRTVIENLQKEPLEHLPNMLFYGVTQIPLEYLAYALVKERLPQKRKHMWNDTLPYFECERFFEIQCTHPSMPKNYTLLCEFMKHILTSQCIHENKHIIILRDIDIIAQSEYHYALRVLLERFSQNVLFIGTTHHLSKLETPLLSRFMLLRIPSPNMDTLTELGKQIAPSIEPYLYIHKHSSIMETLFRLYMKLHEHDMCLLDNDADLKVFLSKTRTFEEIRTYAFRVFQRGIPFAEFCFHLIENIKPAKYQSRLIQELANLEHQLVLSSRGREPIYYEKALWMTAYASTLWKTLIV